MGHITSKTIAHLKMEPQKEVQGTFAVVNSPRDIMNTFHLAGTGSTLKRLLKYILVML